MPTKNVTNASLSPSQSSTHATKRMIHAMRRTKQVAHEGKLFNLRNEIPSTRRDFTNMGLLNSMNIGERENTRCCYDMYIVQECKVKQNLPNL